METLGKTIGETHLTQWLGESQNINASSNVCFNSGNKTQMRVI